ncbi:MAG: acyl-CoA dehydrogenase family protein, partial [Rhodoglobus sp.]
MMLDADQKELARGAREFLKEACPPEVVRAAWAGDALEPLRHALVEMGFYALVIPPEHGGLGLGGLEATLLLEECGRIALPLPLLESLVAAAGIARHGTAEQKDRWLAPIAAGEARATIQVEGWGAVVGAEQADVLVVATHGDELHVVPAAGFHAEPVPVFDHSRRVSRVTFTLGDDTRMDEGPEPARDLRNHAAALSAAVLL